MPLSPPWKWMMQDQPADGNPCWIVRIGEPEKPFRADWDAAYIGFHTTDLPVGTDVPSIVVLKWRLQ